MCFYIYCTFDLLQLLDIRDNFVLLTAVILGLGLGLGGCGLVNITG